MANDSSQVSPCVVKLAPTDDVQQVSPLPSGAIVVSRVPPDTVRTLVSAILPPPQTFGPQFTTYVAQVRTDGDLSAGMLALLSVENGQQFWAGVFTGRSVCRCVEVHGVIFPVTDEGSPGPLVLFGIKVCHGLD